MERKTRDKTPIIAWLDSCTPQEASSLRRETLQQGRVKMVTYLGEVLQLHPLFFKAGTRSLQSTAAIMNRIPTREVSLEGQVEPRSYQAQEIPDTIIDRQLLATSSL